MTIEQLVARWESVRDTFYDGRNDLDRAEIFAAQLLVWIGIAPERLIAFEELVGDDMTSWLLDLVSSLVGANRVDEAIKWCGSLAPLGNAEMFLGDQVTILSEAGRNEEAITAAEALLKRFPDHAWCHVFAADAFRRAGDDPRAEGAYLRALELDPTDQFTVEGVLERLVPWLNRLGRLDEARRIASRARSRLG